MALSFQQIKKVIEIMEFINGRKFPITPYNEDSKFDVETILIERNEVGECQNIFINYPITISNEIIKRYLSISPTQPFSSYVTEVTGDHNKLYQIGWFG
ncbi:hypothetical protein CMT52_16965 [Elizabethkingia anophelis]|nr:hypothetical protein [Elizabethkingia anophelis]